MIIRELSVIECTGIIEANRLARLACSRDDRPYLIPIFYAYSDACAYVFSLPGRKLEIMRANPNVALLIEEQKKGREWKSVVAEGRFEELPDRIGHKLLRDRAWSLLSQHAGWWEPGALKPVRPPLADASAHVFFRIRIDSMTGREAIED